MLKINRASRYLPFALLLAACAPQESVPIDSPVPEPLRTLIGDWDIEEIRSLPRPEDAFERALFEEYVRLGAEESAEADWGDTTFFLRRARALSRGDYREPTNFEQRDIPASSLAELTSGRARLMSVLSSSRRQDQPTEAARAQASFDCWMQEREENFQANDISGCRADFLATMDKLESKKPQTLVVLLPDLDGRVGQVEFITASGTRVLTEARAATTVDLADDATPSPAFEIGQEPLEQTFSAAIEAQPLPPESFIIFFELRSAELTEASAAQIPQILAAIARHPAAEVEIVGHADRSGTDQYNDALSLRRANEIRQRLAGQESAIRTLRVSAQGEKNPIVATPDGVAEPQNRRVEITVR